jgi:hypothetical protein
MAPLLMKWDKKLVLPISSESGAHKLSVSGGSLSRIDGRMTGRLSREAWQTSTPQLTTLAKCSLIMLSSSQQSKYTRDDGIPLPSPSLCRGKATGQHILAPCKSPFNSRTGDFSSGLQSVEDSFGEDHARGTE